MTTDAPPEKMMPITDAELGADLLRWAECMDFEDWPALAQRLREAARRLAPRDGTLRWALEQILLQANKPGRHRIPTIRAIAIAALAADSLPLPPTNGANNEG